MKIGVIGDAKRALTWEKHLRALSTVTEVIIVKKVQDIKHADVCLLIDDSDQNLNGLLSLIKKGFHTYLISRLPTEITDLEKIHHAAREANVQVQFSHWPSFTPSTLWFKQQLKKPAFIQIIKEESRSEFQASSVGFRDHWVDELAFILNWMGIKINHIEPALITIDDIQTGIQIFIRFANGSSASLIYLSTGKEDTHRRLISGSNVYFDCNANTQSVRITKSERGILHYSAKTFDAAKTAELSVVQFLKSIQLKTHTQFDSYIALETAKIADQIDRLIAKQ